jgi:uncharacterized protein YcbK (DUF882 family)
MTVGKKAKQFNKKIYIIIGLGFVLAALFISFLILRNKKTEEKRQSNYIGCNQIENASAPISPSIKLNDKNDIHILHAQTNGLKQSFESNEAFLLGIDSLINNGVLIEVTNNSFYQLKKLTHSHPYLIPEAVDMLNDIGYRFQKRLHEKGYPRYQFRITSLLRTEETQNKLSKRNGNATGHSAHIYGTTLDISYKDFYNVEKDTIESNYIPVQALTQILIEMRKECKLLVVRERKQSCFHITVVMCKPKL